MDDKRITELVANCYEGKHSDRVCSLAIERAIKQAIAEATPLIRKDEREKVALMIESQPGYPDSLCPGCVQNKLRNQTNE